MKPVLTLLSLLLVTTTFLADEPVDIGLRRELLVDDALVERLVGRADLRLHQPTPQNVALSRLSPVQGATTP